MHKTGSSSIQQTLAALPQNGNVIYASFANFDNHSLPFIGMFAETPEKHHIFRRQGNSRSEIKAEAIEHKASLIEQFNRYKTENFIISGEGIIYLSESELLDVYAFLKSYFDEIIVCAYIRAPISFMESAFQQRLKNGKASFNIIGPDYKNKFAKFEKVFGAESVQYWAFNQRELKNGCVVEDFCSKINFKFSPQFIKQKNIGLSLDAIKILYYLKKNDIEISRISRGILKDKQLVRLLSSIKGSKLRFGNELSEKLIRENSQDIAWMQKRLESSLNEDNESNGGGINYEKDLLNVNFKSSYKFSLAVVQFLVKSLGTSLVLFVKKIRLY
ncbi:hypothetical protein THMIRHAM_05380 [Thiomicrorhabdus immobilis]|uniref:Uncharacterized protein n=2 Tax=Thiomicrorhabdus immobilis TaxID=2791037 RepID=A0ABN6CUU8_9GAMM|nr:hypothetical protein THMIRHAM_05380 [Thiomicrorhabdus immobilis]